MYILYQGLGMTKASKSHKIAFQERVLYREHSAAAVAG